MQVNVRHYLTSFYIQIMDSDKAAIVENSEEDIEEVEEEEEGCDKLSKEKLQAAVLQNPRVMAALQARLDSMVGDPSGYIKVTISITFITMNDAINTHLLHV